MRFSPQFRKLSRTLPRKRVPAICSASFSVVCAGESIDESNSSFAVDVRRLLREQIAEGRTDKQIQDFFVARYGDAILTKPPLQPATWLLWLGPFRVLAIAGGVAWITIKRAGKAGI